MIPLKKCNAPEARLSLALAVALTILSPVGAANRITDTTGYATLAATDDGGTYSLVPSLGKKNWNWNDEVIAVQPGIDFLVQNGYTVRSYGATGAGITFSGDSLTLDNCMVKLSMPNTNQVYVIPLLYLYNANVNIAQANGGGTLRGDFHLRGETGDEATFSHTSGRTLNVAAALHGDAGRVVRVRREDPVTGKAFGIAYFTGDNSDYRGTFVCAGDRTNVAIAAGSPTALGAGTGDVLTLSSEGTLFGMLGYAFTNATQTLKLSDGGLVGTANPGETFTFGGGTAVSGTGRLSCGISGDMSWSSSTVFGDVTVSGIDGIVLLGGDNVFTPGYSGEGIPVTAKDGAAVVVGGEPGSTATLASLALEGASPEIRVSCATNGEGAVACDLLNVAGTLAKDADAKIRIAFDEIPRGLGREVSVRVLESPSLGSTLTKDDFTVAFPLTSVESISFSEGAFSIETDGGNKYLVWTWTSRQVVYWEPNGGDHAWYDNNPSYWSNGQSVSGDYDYVTAQGILRSRVTETFGGHSLSVMRGADFALTGGSLTCRKMRLFAGGVLTARAQGGQRLLGTAEVVDDGTGDPFLFSIESDSTGTRKMWLESTLTGSGNIEFAGYQRTSGKSGQFHVLGDNRTFTGRIMIRGKDVYSNNGYPLNSEQTVSAVVWDQNALGGDPATFMADGIRILRGGVLVVSNDVSVTGNRGVTIGQPTGDWTENLHIGGFDVPEGKTLTIDTPITGPGRILKMGSGTLRLARPNSYISRTLVTDGTLDVVCTNSFGTGAGIGTSASGLIRLSGDNFPYRVAGGGVTAFLNQQGCVWPTRIEVPALGDGSRKVTLELFFLPSADPFDPTWVDIVNVTNKSALSWHAETRADGQHVFCTVAPQGMTIIFR